MNDFILRNRELYSVPKMLVDAVPSFGQSEEFNDLDEDERKVPGLVCAAFTKRLRHLHRLFARTGVGTALRVELDQYYAAIEEMASSADPEVKNLVVVEVFENFGDKEVLQRELKPYLLSTSLELYNRWIC